MEKSKLTAVYVRTGSKKQNISVQLEAASHFVEGIEPEKLAYFIDEGVSASSQSTELQKLMDLIRKDKVETLIVYQRDRLSRSVDTYLEIINLITRHQVKVVFTAPRKYYDSSILGDIYTEGLYALMLSIERTMNSNRIREGLKYRKSLS